MTVGPGWRLWRSMLLEPLTDAMFRRNSQSPVLQRHANDFPGASEEAAAAAEAAKEAGFAVDSDWRQRRLMAAALDRKDNMSRLLRISLTSAGSLDVHGVWPQGPFIALGMHWGAGFPMLESLQRSGRTPAFVYRPEEAGDLDSVPARLYDRLHMIALDGFGNSIRVGGAYQKIVDALDLGHVPVVLFDAPASRGSKTISVQRAGRKISLRAGVFGLLADRKIKCVFFRCGCRRDSDRRLLEISAPVQSGDSAVLFGHAVDFLVSTLARDSAQWHFWTTGKVVTRCVRLERPNQTSDEIPGELCK